MESIKYSNVKSNTLGFATRRGKYYDINEILKAGSPASEKEIAEFEKLDLIYRTVCGILYNFVPTSGHPGGSISSGRAVTSLLFRSMDYDIGAPEREDADIVSYAAGHKAMGLYSMWALRNEVVRTGRGSLLPKPERQLRL